MEQVKDLARPVVLSFTQSFKEELDMFHKNTGNVSFSQSVRELLRAGLKAQS